MEVTSVSPPSGQGRQSVYNGYDEECRQRRGIVAINNTDNMCLPRALVVAKANVDKDPNYKILRDRKGIQKIHAQRLLQEASVVIPPNDSLNFFPMALSALPKALGLGEELKKGYFPHLFNTEENSSYVGPLPAVKYYSLDSMKPDARALFLKWYDEHKQDVFDMQRDLVEYCRSDVDILKRACMQFRDMFINECDVDPFTESITIASACNLMFRRKFLQPDTIGVIPKGGYRRADNQSLVAIQWLVWEEDTRGIKIQHAGRQRELKINGMRVDGYCESKVFEFYGCYFHGCTNCFLTNRNERLHDDEPLDTMDHRYENTTAKATRLRALGYEVVEMWECSFKRELKSNFAMEYLREHPMLKSAPLNPRDAFYGGRTGCTKLKYTVKEGEKIKYVDVCSLYPYICKYGRFPLKHPEVFVGKECKNYIDRNGIPHGVIKCSILPPQNMYHPVLPVKKHNKLMFPLCMKCVEDLVESECSHNPEERTICGTWCSDEIVKALDKGYKLIEVHEMWVYDTTRYDKTINSGGLFSEFINHFVRIKQQASDWPSSCCTREQRDKYIEEFFESEGVQLKYEDIMKNPGLRSLAKLMLNSFWGKFGQRENQSKTSILRDPKEFYDLMWSPSIDVNYLQEVNDEIVIMNWQYKEEAVEPLFTVNCVIAAYVTTQARLQLYSYLDLLGDRVLYYDTDSVIYVSRENQPDLPLGNNLGDLTDEIEGEYGPSAFITEFASGGPKTYGYLVQLPSGKTKTVIKVKGLTLNHQNLEKVNFDSLVDLIDHTDQEILTLNSVIRRTEDHQLITKMEEKKFRVNVKKRRRVDDYDTVPYGYKRS
ncbi:hypothetical protein RI129_013149 [Pyrocoelia pectoralis]|uniref:DNA-directed DNA polymerase n=1 Tax=Pyrocoelia pectoralis TaxID=417401 RepID=A0AAN7V8N6_9COLE